MRKYIISLLIMILMVTIGVHQVQSQLNMESKTKTELKTKNKIIVAKENNICNNIVDTEVKQEPEYIIMQATAYDLSIQCCGKSYSNPSRGKARDGYNLTNKSHSEAWTVSSNKYSLGTKLQLEFPKSHKNFSGVYTVRDTGNFKENVLDIYVGDFGEKVSQDTINFGRVDVKVVEIKEKYKNIDKKQN